jgi:tetratricopeptide (TPR) repeat protein
VRRRVLAIAVAAVLAGAMPAHAARKARPTGTISDLTGTQVEVETGGDIAVSAADAIAQYRRFLALDGVHPELRAEALRRLADLELERDEAARASDPAITQTPALAESIELYQQLLAQHPDYDHRDTVMYQLGRAYEASQAPEQALEVLGRLVTEFPDSEWFVESQFRRGEILFVDQRYGDAEAAYAAVLARGPASGYYEQALYKHGWALFKQSRGEEGADSFFALLDSVLAPGGTLRDPATLERAEQELVDDALRVVAITLADLDGPATLDALLDRRGDPLYVAQLYAALGDWYLEKERYQDAADAYSAFSARRPDAEQAPLLQVRAIEAYRQGGFESRVLASKQEFVERYALGSPYWATRTFADAPEVAGYLESNLKDLASYHHAKAQQDRTPAEFDAAARWYRALLDTFPDRESAPQIRYLLAEVLFEGGRYAAAAVEYERTAYEYGAHPRAAEAGYAALIAYEKHEATLTGEDRAIWHSQMTDSKVRFATAFPEHPHAGEVLTSAAEDLYAARDYESTIGVSRQVLAMTPPVDPDKRRIASTLLAHSLFERQRYVEAESAYLALEPLIGPADPLRADVVERIAASIYRQGEAKQAAGDGLGAVDDFLRVATLAPTSTIRAKAEYDAASQLVQLGEWQRATGVLETFRAHHPNDALAPEVTRTLAAAYLETGRGVDAAAEFERIAARAEEPQDVRRAAAWQAAELYQQADRPAQAAGAYAKYVQQFPRPLDAAMDARSRLVDLSIAMHDPSARDLWRNELIRADREAGSERTDRSRYLAAGAALALTEPAAEQFRAVRLVAPLEVSMAAKQGAMERVIALYSAALDYQVAEVTTAATYGMAEVYRTLGRDLMASDRPPELSQEELEQYDLLLEEQAFPFEEKAIELHEVNARRAQQGIYDDWVQRSFAALAQLVPARYAKVEMGETHVATLN